MNELEILLDAYKNAVFQKDLEAFLSLFDKNVRVFDMWEPWSFEGLPAWRDMVTGWFSSLGADRDRISFEAVEFQWSGGLTTTSGDLATTTSGDLATSDLAIVTAFARFAAISPEGHELRFLHNRLTLVVLKKAGSWKIIHQHTSAPLDGTLKVILQR